MKRTFTVFITMLITAYALNSANAVQPAFTLTAKNFVYTDSIGLDGIDAMKFDIYLLHTNTGASGAFEFALGQYYFNINGALGPSSDYNYYIVPGSTTFTNVNAVPRNPTFVSPDASSPTGASLKINSNAILGVGNGPIVSTVAPGTRVCTMRFKKKSGSFPITAKKMSWRLADPVPYTKIFATISTVGTDISANGTYSIDSLSSFVTLSTPSDNSLYNPVSLKFVWRKFKPTSTYILQVYSDSLLTNKIFNFTVNTDTFKTISGFGSDQKYYWRVGAKDTGNAIYYSTVWNFRTIPSKHVSIKLILEGNYYPLFSQMSRRDTVTSYIHNITFPYGIVDSAKSVIDSISFKGLFRFLNVPTGTYYIAVKNFNTMETWSKAGGELLLITDTTNYDFTTAANKAYGNNLILKGGKYCIYSGNVNGDAIVDASDLSEVDNDSYSALSGRFLRSDVNADGTVDAADVSQVDNNRSVVINRPFF